MKPGNRRERNEFVRPIFRPPAGAVWEVKRRFAARAAAFFAALGLAVIGLSAHAQVSNDFRTVTSGNWTDTGTWEQFDGTAWLAATTSPGSDDGVITIQSGHIVTNFTDATVDQVVVAAGGQLHVNAGVTLTLTDGAGTDLDVFGTLQISGDGIVSGGSGTSFQLQPGATLGIGSTEGITSTGDTGNIQTATRTFSTTANYIFLGTAAQATGHGLPATVNNLTIANSAGVQLTAATEVNGTLALDRGVFSLSGNVLTISGDIWTDSGTILGGMGADMIIGDTDGAPANILFNGGATMTLPSIILNNLTINRTNGIALDGNVTVNGTLTLTRGKIFTGANGLYLGSDATVSGAGSNSYVHGNVQKAFLTGNGQAFDFPVGDAANYLPVSLTSLNVLAPGNILVGTTAGEQPDIATSGINATRDVNRYWTIAGTDIVASDYSATFTFADGDVDADAVPAVFTARRHDGSWSALTAATRTATSIQVTGVNGFSDFAVGELTSKLVFVQQPTKAPGNKPISPAVTVQLQDNDNHNVAAAGVPVVMSLSSGSGTLGGTLTIPTDANGLATFAGLSVNHGGLKVLTATATGLSNAVSDSFMVGIPAEPPAITCQPTNLLVTVGDGAVFAVTATGTGPLSYQWLLDGTNVLSSGVLFSGTASATLTITNASRPYAGCYSIVISNAVGLVASSNVTLAVALPPGVLFHDDFARILEPGAVSPWLVESGNWAATDGVLLAGANDLGSYGFTHLNKTWTDYYVQAQLQLPADAYGGGIGGRLDPTTGTHYAAWIYPEGSAGGSNVLRLVKFSDWATYTVLAETNLVAVGTNPHTVKLTFVGEQIRVHYDANLLIETTDSSYASGSIALGMWTEDTEYAMTVDNVIVHTINTAPVLPVIDAQTVTELATLSVTNTASDDDVPVNTLSYQLINPPANASINARGVITFTPDETQGSSTNVITTVVTDDGSPNLSATNSFAVIVDEGNSAPILPVIGEQSVAEGSQLNVNYAATDSDVPVNGLIYSLVNPPSGASIDANGLITWTPAEDQGPTTNILTAVVNDGMVSVTNSFTVIVTEVNAPPAPPSIGQQIIAEGSLLSVNNAATDSDLPVNTLNYSLLNPPPGASISGSGVITWTPDESQGPGTHTITAVVNDGTANVTNSFTVIVTEVNSAPVLPAIGGQSVVEGNLLSVNNAATDNDLPANTLTYSLVNPPAGASIDGNGLITWTPTEAQGPSTNILTTIVNDGNASATNTITVVVSEGNQAPSLPAIGEQTVAEGNLLSVNNAAADNDLPVNALNYSLVNPPAGASVDASGLITWTPTELQGPSTNSIITIVSDGTASATNTFTVVVSEVNQAPSLPAIGEQIVAEGNLLSVNNAATDSDIPANTLTYTLVNPPDGATINASGVITWTPTESQGPGTEIITTIVSDGNASATNTFTVNVTEVNTAPVLPVLGEQTIAEGSLLSVNNAATDPDIPANTLNYSLVNPPDGATINASGVITWTPTEQQGPGTNVLTTIVSDGIASATNTFSVVVTEVNTAPVLSVLGEQTIAEGSLLSVNNGATDSDIPANPLSYSLVNPPSGASIDSNGVITWTPTEGQGPSTNTLTTIVNDGTANATNTLTVFVTEVNTAPVLPTLGEQTIAEGSLLSVNNAATDSDLPANLLSYSLVNPPSGATISASGVITWTPTEAQGPGTDTITTIVSDGSASATNSFSVIVTEVNTAPVLSALGEQTIAEGSLLSVNNGATDSDIPANTLSYSLVNPPAGATINTSGVITWTPTETQGPATNIITTVASDGIASATNNFTVIVTEVNTAPVLPVIGQQNVNELSLLTVNNGATDSDLPANPLSYSLVNPPSGASIDGNGVITWIPTELQGPGTNILTTIVSDGTVSATNSFTVIVTEVNTAPALPTIGQQSVNELSLLTVTNGATDSDLPGNTLSYHLINPLAGMVINGNGVISWTPSEAQGPSTNIIATVVTDNGNPAMSTTNTFTVTVAEVNTGPTLPAQSTRTIAELSTLTVTNTASDNDLPANPLTYQLANPPNGAGIDAQGVITWTPTESQGPSTNTFVTVVTDDGSPGLLAINVFTVIVTEANVAPVLPAQSTRTIAEMSTLTVNNAATDSDLPANTLTYSLLNPPSGAVIDGNGVITWTPTEAQGPNTNTLTTIVNDGSASTTNSFTVIVTEVNTAPVLLPIGLQTIAEGSLFTVNNSATDADLPANPLSYSLVNPPSGASINASGVITWTPTEAQGPGTNSITTIVSDGTASATNTFKIIVTEVNTAPVLPIISTQTIAEGSLLTVNNGASDGDLPANPLSYLLVNPPGGVTINASGVITWTPTEAQGPGSNTITTIVSDGTASATNSFTVIVSEVNTPSVLPVIGEQTVAEGSLLTVTNTATDGDIPANTLSYALINPPGGANINSNGVISWTPSEAQGPSANIITTVVSDGLGSVTNTFTVIVAEVNTEPTLSAQSTRTIAELSTLTVTNTASDSDLPANPLTYQLLNPPSGAVIDSQGVITWTPTEAQGPGTNIFVTLVNDNGSPELLAINVFTVIVTEANTTPVLPAQTNRTIAPLTTLTVTNAASDSDLPVNTLTYSLLNPPSGASINASGVIAWTPTELQGPSTNVITTVVTDNGTPAKSATNSFTVMVTAAENLFQITSITVSNGVARITWNSVAGQTYRLQYKDTLSGTSWTDVTPDVQAFGPTTSMTNAAGNATMRLYRVMLVTGEAVVPPPVIQSVSISGGVATVRWTSVAGRNYRLQYKNNLGSTNWTDVTPDVPATAASTTRTDTVGNAPQRFYRVMMLVP